MCEPSMIIGGLALAAGSYLQSDAQNDAMDKQQSAINAALEQQDQYSKQAEQTALENAQQYDPTKRTEEFEKARESAGQSLAKQLLESREAAPQSSQPAGRLSQEYLTGEAESKQNQLEKSIGMANLMGRMRGMTDLLTDEGIRNADYASRLNTIGRNATGSYNAAQPGIVSAGKVNSGSMLAGGLLSGIGGSALSSGLSGMLSPAAGGGAVGTMGSGTYGMGDIIGGTKNSVPMFGGGWNTGFNLGSGLRMF